MTSTETSSGTGNQPASDCLFCKIVAGELPADVVASTERIVAFRDIDPKAPVHVLVVPREHHGDVSVLAAADPELLAEVVEVADRVAHDLADGQYRFIFNSGPRAGQSVFHVHGHVIAGAQLGWSPA
ncbi:histidine triad nucleotide-binding protein [Isoptericola cucumis]|uniref:Histidine triad nucleotide-binding protein n=1 Tax=Isoptericola cucumis TaxID=1776856 RepID=A0ABQ2B5B1_9MICO|nr:histidine triad nucleotide-binding protein [Isoptericola cucumis]GGI06495.1 histidine triad nucleotide-binding protein [Isoptericola cucumis]